MADETTAMADELGAGLRKRVEDAIAVSWSTDYCVGEDGGSHPVIEFDADKAVENVMAALEETAFEAGTMALVASARLLVLSEILDPESTTSLSCCARMVSAWKLAGEAREQLLGIAKLLTALAGGSQSAAEPQETDESAGENFLREISLLQESRSRLAGACRWLLPHFEEAVRDGGDHFEQRFCEEAVRRLRDALEGPGGPSPAAEPKATRTTAVGPDGAVWGWET
jgi:hypothetical protein